MKSLMLILTLISTQALAYEFKPFAGLNLGIHQVDGKGAEQAKDGFSGSGKLIGSFEFDTFFIDATAGYGMMSLKSSQVQIDTRYFVGELEARYKLSKSWSLGGGLRTLAGTDNTNAETKGASSVSNNLMAKAMYHTEMNSVPVRLELGLGTSLGEDRTANMVMVGVQFGFPWSKPKKVAPAAPVVVERMTQVPPESEVADIKINLKFAKVNFQTNKFEIGPVTAKKFKKLAKVLKENNANWKRVKISGHTDITGDATLNKRLSQDRADSVMKELVLNGVDESKLSAFGYGSSRPVDPTNSPEAWQKNRRTEIEFFGITNRQEFNQKLTEALSD